MPKLRKMLGNVTDPVVQSLMGLIETQSRSTLAHWAVNCAAQRYLPIYESAYPEDSRLRDALFHRPDAVLRFGLHLLRRSSRRLSYGWPVSGRRYLRLPCRQGAGSPSEIPARNRRPQRAKPCKNFLELLMPEGTH